MNRHMLAMAVAGSVLLSGSWATADEAEDVRKEVLRRITIKSTKIESAALKKVFSATFYEVTIDINEGNGTSHSKMLLVKKDAKFINLKTTSTTQKMPGLLSLVTKGFKLKTEADAKVFEAAIDTLYPIKSFGSAKKVKAIKKTATGWTFIRGTFFKDMKGFEVATDDKGVIQSIGYSLRIKKSD